MKRFLKQLFLVAFGAAFAMLLVMCGPPSMSMMGDAMVDVGMTLRDGSDTSMPDAMAQDCATDCTGGGVLRVMTADTDPDQLVTETIIHRGSGTSEVFEILSGPFVLTDIGLAEERAPHTDLRIIPAPACPMSPTRAEPTSFTVIALDGQAGTTSVNTRYAHEIHGGRYYVPAGSRVCAYVAGDTTWEVRYAGFRPYD